MVVMAASDEAELKHMVATARAIDDAPSAFRYPRGSAVGVEMPSVGVPLEIGKGRIICEGSKIALLSLGGRLQECIKAAEELGVLGLSTTVADARFAKPIDHDLIRRLAKNHEALIIIEEGSVGGFASHVLTFLAEDGILDNGLKVRTMGIPDRFVAHGEQVEQYSDAGLMAENIIATSLAALGMEAIDTRSKVHKI